MRDDFQDALAFVLEMEGDYSNDPADPGGETKFGISKKAYPNLDIKNLTVDEAGAIYRRDYWKPCHGDELPRAFAIAVFDSAVNQGVKTAIRIFQRGLGVKVDGIIGPKTIAAAKKGTNRMIRLVLAERLIAYARLIRDKPDLGVFARNWFHRVLALLETLRLPAI